MTKKQAIKLFEEKKVRTVWDDEKEQWYFCVVDVVEVLTESKDPSGYIKTMKRRDPILAKGWGQIVTPLSVQTAGGRQKMNCATIKGIFRIIQAIPSSKAEPLKQWIAPMVCNARHSSPLNTYTVTGYATVASSPAEPPERVRTCSTEFAA